MRPRVPEPIESHTGPTRILIIDDDPLLGAMLQRMLKRHQCAAFVARGGREGIEMARSMKPSAILCDESMPEVSGRDVVAALKSDPATARIPILLMSGYGDPALAVTANGFISKPFDAADVVAALQAVLKDSAAGSTPDP